MIALMIMSIFGCSSEQEIKALRWDDVALVSGDFDHMGASLVRMGIDYTEFEGFISQAVYNPEISSDSFQLTVEYLLEGETESGGLVMSEYDVLFINSGTRGLGDLEYNSMDEDNAFVSNPVIAENLYRYFEGNPWCCRIGLEIWLNRLGLMPFSLHANPAATMHKGVGISVSPVYQPVSLRG